MWYVFCFLMFDYGDKNCKNIWKHISKGMTIRPKLKKHVSFVVIRFFFKGWIMETKVGRT